jgi:glycine oxidase
MTIFVELRMNGDNRLSVGIVGAGVLGRLIALKGESLGWKVTLFDKGDEAGSDACSFRPPAMLAPYCERDVAEPLISDLGVEALKLWPDILRLTEGDTFFQQAGSLVVAHPHNRGEMAHYRASMTAKLSDKTDPFRPVTSAEIAELEPQLDKQFQDGLFFPHEGQVDSRKALQALAKALKDKGIECRYGCDAPTMGAKQVTAGGENHDFDLVIDARGYGAKDDLPELRAVRGEIIRVRAPDVHLNRPIRLLHPRYPLYVVPHENGEYVIGATSIESDDDSPISVRSTLELLSAAYALHSGFSEARIIDMSVGLRPAFPDNMPRIYCEDGLLRVNGLYRHGYLISPKIAELACNFVANGVIDPTYASLFRVKEG